MPENTVVISAILIKIYLLESLISSENSISALAGLRNIILIGSLYGFHGVITRSLVIENINEPFLVTTRIFCVTIIFGIYARKDFYSQINFDYFKKGALSGFLAIYLPGWSFIYALNFISSGLNSIFISTIPMFTLVWVYLFYKEEKVTILKIISVIFGFIGLLILFQSGISGIQNGGNLIFGGLLSLIGVQGLALSNITNRKFSQYIPSKTFMLTQWLTGTVLSVFTFILVGGEISKLTDLTLIRIFALISIDVISYSLFLYTIKRISATFTTLVDYIVPIIGISAGFFFLGEFVDKIFFVTLMFIFISLFLAVKDESKNFK
jgi:drug/metabolite transporter (DMT)-like permease